MSESSEQRDRLETGPIDTAFLIEIADTLAELKKLALEQRPEGITEPIPVDDITHLGELVEAPVSPWFSVTIINDGPRFPVGARVNPKKSTSRFHIIRVNESYKFEFSRAVIDAVQLQCESGETASARLIGVR